MVRLSVVPVLAVIALQLGCGHTEPKLTVEVSPNVARGTQTQVRLSNACRGSRNCDGVDLTEVDSISVANPTIAQITRTEEDDRPGILYFNLSALGAGSTTIHAAGTFEDGTQGDASARVNVIDVDRIQVDAHQCSPLATDPLLVQHGNKVEFEVSLWASGQELAGGVMGLVRGEGVRHLSASVYEFEAPNRDVRTPLESPLLSETGITLEAFGAERITRVDVASFDGARQGEAFGVNTFVEVDGRIPCTAGPATVTTLTPDICAGPSGEATWNNSSLTLLIASPIGTGTCRLSVSPEGSSLESEIEFAIDLE